MGKSDYTNWSKEELVKEIGQLKKRKKYGLVWEDNPENVVEQCKIELPILEEVKKREVLLNQNDPVNLLIEGDNFHALSVLNYTHKGMVDVIYIDPPYNTGARDWKYNNDYVDINDQWRHSKWISFMKNRLSISKNLLSKDGVIIIAIDDNEFCTLGMLVDEIFPNKIRNTVVIVNNPHGVARSGFSRCHEYALFLLNPGQVINKKPAPEDKREINLRRSGNNSLRTDSPTMFYPIYVDKKTLHISGAGEVPEKDFHPKQQMKDLGDRYEIWPIDSKNIEKNWYYSKKRVIEKGKQELFCKWVKSQLHIYFNHSNNSEQTYKSVWTGSEYDAGAYGATLVKKLANNYFPFPKSINTLIDCLRAVLKKKDAIVLDYFAGSGTTGHAILELNKQDGGNRKFILCTNNENSIAEEVCYPRIKKVIEGYKETDGTIINGLGGNLKYYKTAFISAEVTDKNKIELTKKATEMLCVKEATFEEVFSNKQYKIFKNKSNYTAIIFDHLAIDDFKTKVQKFDKKCNVFIFSLGDDSFDDEFKDVSNKVTISPIPESILRVYRRIFK